jgi:membrane-associated phospholipid phosphatase
MRSHAERTVAPSGSQPTSRRTDRAARSSRHGPVAQLLIAWSPLSLILVAYAVAGWISRPLDPDAPGEQVNRLGFPLHTQGPATVDRWLFGEHPSAWLQERLLDTTPHWWDALAALVYVTHFVTIPVLTAVAWFAVRERFARWLATVVAFTVVGIAGYVVYPATPPWLTTDDGVRVAQRSSAFGWDYLHLHPVTRLLDLAQAVSNPVAAMPSLHAGSALLVALFAWPSVRPRWRAVLLTYALLMAATLVYTGEHYVVDVVAGWATAITALTLGRAAERWWRRHRTGAETTGPGTRPPVASRARSSTLQRPHPQGDTAARRDLGRTGR